MPNWFPWRAASPQNLYLATVLITLIVSAVFGVILPASLQSPRAHHYEKVVNECLANHQIIYLPFYVTLISIGKFTADEEWVRGLMLTIITVTLIFAVAGYLKVRGQDKFLAKRHDCRDSECEHELDRNTKVKLYRTNIILSVISIFVASVFVFNPIFARKQSQAPTTNTSQSADPQR